MVATGETDEQLADATRRVRGQIALSGSTPVSASQIKSTAGIVRSVFGRLDASLAGGAYYVHLYNAVTGVAAGVIGPDLISPQKVFHFNGIDSRFCIDLTAEGAFFSGGLQVAASSTETSFTPIASALSVTALYK